MLSNKFILRWLGIFLISFMYFLCLIISSNSLSVLYENQSMQLSDPVPLSEYLSAVDLVVKSTDNIFVGAIFGYLICTILSLLVFKKVR